ncbi:MAG: hypothetical protein ACFE9P_10155 [Candidatus Hermodarchaeota archaeon]
MNVNIICPTCKNSKDIAIPQYKSTHLITVSIPKGMVCEHHFQAFIDKNYVIRGYQKVDIDLKEQDIEQDNEKILSLKDIYNEFWEFIDNDNALFADFIKNDERRTSNENRIENVKIKDFISNLENEILSDNS